MVNFVDGVTKLNANNLNKVQTDLQEEIIGEDWNVLPLASGVLATDTGYGGTAHGIIYRKIGNKVALIGSVSAGGTGKILGTLPEGYRPQYRNFFFVPATRI